MHISTATSPPLSDSCQAGSAHLVRLREQGHRRTKVAYTKEIEYLCATLVDAFAHLHER